jgi:hypothetical protein
MSHSHDWCYIVSLAAMMPRGLRSVLLTLLLPQLLWAASIRPGDIIIDDFGTGRLQVYSPAGTLRTEISGTGGLWFGAAVLPGTSQPVTTHRTGPGGVNIFTAAGAEQLSFPTPDVDIAGDISVFQDSTLAVSSQLTNRIELYATSGSHVGGFAVPGQPVASTVGPDNALWIAKAFTPGLSAYKQDGTFVRTIAPNIVIGDVAIDPTNGTLWVSQNTSAAIFNFDLLGNQLTTFTTAVNPGFLAGQQNFRGLED